MQSPAQEEGVRCQQRSVHVQKTRRIIGEQRPELCGARRWRERTDIRPSRSCLHEKIGRPASLGKGKHGIEGATSRLPLASRCRFPFLRPLARIRGRTAFFCHWSTFDHSELVGIRLSIEAAVGASFRFMYMPPSSIDPSSDLPVAGNPSGDGEFLEAIILGNRFRSNCTEVLVHAYGTAVG